MHKKEANEVLGIFERNAKGECTREKALQDVGEIIKDAIKRADPLYYKQKAARMNSDLWLVKFTDLDNPRTILLTVEAENAIEAIDNAVELAKKAKPLPDDWSTRFVIEVMPPGIREVPVPFARVLDRSSTAY